jgi:hypothetical protein
MVVSSGGLSCSVAWNVLRGNGKGRFPATCPARFSSRSGWRGDRAGREKVGTGFSQKSCSKILESITFYDFGVPLQNHRDLGAVEPGGPIL